MVDAKEVYVVDCLEQRDTTDAHYLMGIHVRFVNHTEHAPETVAYVTPYLKTTKSIKRYQHHWYIEYIRDGIRYGDLQYGGNLPDDTTAADTNKRGYLNMSAGLWYQWGPTREFSVPNDGEIHSFGIAMHCVGTIPNKYPCFNYDLNVSFRFPQYSVTTYAPNLTVTFDKSTRELKYTWTPANCEYITLTNVWYDADGRTIHSGSVDGPSGNKLYNNQQPIIETLPTNVASVEYTMTNHYLTLQTSAKSGTIETKTSGSVSVKLDGVWHKATPWVKVDGRWVKAVAWVRTVDGWKRTTS